MQPPTHDITDLNGRKFLSEMPTAYLADLGIALLIEKSDTTTTHRIGTDGFIAPEVELG